MESSLVDRPAGPAAPTPAEQPPGAAAGAPGRDVATAAAPAGDGASGQTAVPACPRCRGPMAAGQDWCLQCGAGMQGVLGEGGWRSGAAILVVALALVLGAAAAGYAALSKRDRKGPVVTQTVARTPATVPPVATTPLPGTTSTPTPLPGATAKLPKIPLTASTPKVTTPTETAPSTPATEGNSTANTGGASGEGATKAILLDTNAASTYNPYAYPAANFGDPALAIDGDESTGWTARVEPASAPLLAEGLLLDLKTARNIAKLAFVTTTPGMTVQVYGSAAKTVPKSITEPDWVALSHATKDKQRKLSIKLRDATNSFRFVVVWISRAPAGSTAAKPGRVTLNEVELFPTA